MEKENGEKAEEVFRALCKEHGLRITPQRAAVYRELFSSADHPSAGGIYRDVRRSLPNISFDTVYRTLLTFKSRGIIKMVKGTSLKARVEPNLENHHHCSFFACGNIMDCCDSSLDDIEIPEYVRSNLKVSAKRIVLEGVCEACSAD